MNTRTRPAHPDRRQFMASSAAIAVGCAAPQASRLAPASPVPAGDPVMLGLIGAGIRGRNLLKWRLLDHPGFRLRAVCDVDRTRREATAQLVNEHYGSGDCDAYADDGEIYGRDDLDAVVIATPDHWHTLQVVAACTAGKDVYCEKPLTMTLEESRRIIEVVRNTGRVLQTGSQQRTEYEHRFVTACELVRNGRIGRVLNVNVGVGVSPKACDLPAEELEPGLDWDRWLGPAPLRAYHSDLSPRGVHGHYPSWRAYREYSGGYLADMGAHHFDIAQWALRADDSGPVRVVPPLDPAAEHGAALVYADGARLTHGGPSGATFIGTGGMIHVDRGRLLSVPASILEDPLGEDDERLPRQPDQATDWLEAIRSRGRPICDVEVGARSVAICHLLNLAYQHRRELVWDPLAWSFADDEANAWLDYRRREGYELPAS